jgi:hypothetical protein
MRLPSESLEAAANLIAGILAFVAALVAAILSFQANNRVEDLTGHTIYAERFNSAGSFLAADTPMDRLIGLHSLRALAIDNPEYAQRNAQIVATFIRLNSVPATELDEIASVPLEGIDGLEIATAVSHLHALSLLARSNDGEQEGMRFAYDIAHVVLANRDWTGSFSYGGFFDGAHFINMKLDSARWRCVSLKGAVLGGETSVRGARIEYADLSGTDLSYLDPQELSDAVIDPAWNQSSPPILPVNFEMPDSISTAERSAICGV